MATKQPSSFDTPTDRPEELQEPQVATDDDALILWFLSLTPTQRLEVAQGFVDSVQTLRKGRRSPGQETP